MVFVFSLVAMFVDYFIWDCGQVTELLKHDFSQNILLWLISSVNNHISLVFRHACIFVSAGSSVLAHSIEWLYLTSGVSFM